jgi:membrane protein DedA with SNARE-associated domain/rhodanese-related sulfurtransferase
VADILSSLARYGYIAVPIWVFAEQMGLPIPAIPILLAAGTIAGTGKMNLFLVTALTLGAALSADLFWYRVGSAHGSRTLSKLCRVCLEPDSCVRRAKNLLERHGLRSLLVSKFVPGLNALAAPVAGTIRVPWWQFAAVDGVGILVWALTFELLGFAFSNQLEKIAALAWRLGISAIAILLLATLTLYIAQKHRRRQQFMRKLAIARISPLELKNKFDRNEAVTIVDLRHSLDFLPEPYTIPGAIRISMEELDERNDEIPRDRDIVLYCTCPNEASSAITALKLQKHGITRVRPLQGGLHGWRDLGFPLHSEFGLTSRVKGTHAAKHVPDRNSEFEIQPIMTQRRVDGEDQG